MTPDPPPPESRTPWTDAINELTDEINRAWYEESRVWRRARDLWMKGLGPHPDAATPADR